MLFGHRWLALGTRAAQLFLKMALTASGALPRVSDIPTVWRGTWEITHRRLAVSQDEGLLIEPARTNCMLEREHMKQ